MLNQSKNIFIVGIKGVAMANLAVILKKMGKDVTGSDVPEEFITNELLKKNKIIWQVGFDPKNPSKKEIIKSLLPKTQLNLSLRVVCHTLSFQSPKYSLNFSYIKYKGLAFLGANPMLFYSTNNIITKKEL